MAANLSPPATAVGTLRLIVVLSPRDPKSFPPQQYAVPSDVSPQVCTLPAARLVNESPPLTGMGVGLGVWEVDPDPSWPYKIVAPAVGSPTSDQGTRVIVSDRERDELQPPSDGNRNRIGYVIAVAQLTSSIAAPAVRRAVDRQSAGVDVARFHAPEPDAPVDVEWGSHGRPHRCPKLTCQPVAPTRDRAVGIEPTRVRRAGRDLHEMHGANGHMAGPSSPIERHGCPDVSSARRPGSHGT